MCVVILDMDLLRNNKNSGLTPCFQDQIVIRLQHDHGGLCIGPRDPVTGNAVGVHITTEPDGVLATVADDVSLDDIARVGPLHFARLVVPALDAHRIVCDGVVPHNASG